ncbi:SPOSA6832_00793, partial [Sporobolomyces salmonicolor]
MSDETPTFPISPVPKMEEGKFVKTAGCLIIGDEVLNGKTRDSNSNYFAKLCFDLAIDLKRIEIIPDDEAEIIEAVRRMHEKYDLVVTSGGLGPTHDDITYESIAKAFDTTLEYDDETIKRMDAFGRKRYNFDQQTEEQKKARLRMALFPKEAEVLFVQEDLCVFFPDFTELQASDLVEPYSWVPVVRVAGKVCILPGVPKLFERLITGLAAHYIPLPPSSEKPYRILVHTEGKGGRDGVTHPASLRIPESSIAPFLTELHERVRKEGIRVGSYPKLLRGVDVSLIGKNEDRLHELAQEVIKELKGELVAQGKLGQEEQVKK